MHALAGFVGAITRLNDFVGRYAAFLILPVFGLLLEVGLRCLADGLDGRAGADAV